MPLCAPAFLFHHLAAELTAVALNGCGGGGERTKQAALGEILEPLRSREPMEDDCAREEVVGGAFNAVLGEGSLHKVDDLVAELTPAARRDQRDASGHNLACAYGRVHVLLHVILCGVM